MKRLFRAGATVLLLFGAAHMVGHLLGQPPPSNDSQRTLFHLLQTYAFDLAGTKRTMSQLMDGFSLMFSAQSVALGLAGWLAAPNRRLCVTYCAACLTFTAISIVYFFIIPTSFVALAALLFAAAAFRP